MAEGDGKTVLVTGGSGYLGGWCIIELLRKGYSVRTTVRDLKREQEVRANVSGEVDPGDPVDAVGASERAILTGQSGHADATDQLRSVRRMRPGDHRAQPRAELNLQRCRRRLDDGHRGHPPRLRVEDLAHSELLAQDPFHSIPSTA